jgi:phosphonoacetate hydrolase
MGKKVLIICVDGLGPEYLEMAPTPNIDRMAREGSFIIGQAVIPSVTNVNNVSIITGVPPRIHGITSNYWLNKSTQQENFMESPEYLCWPTILQRAKKKGKSTALLTSKKKLSELLNAGADYSLSAEDPEESMIRKIGPAQDIYSPEINLWLMRALRVIMKERDPDLIYCSTTDGMMHKYAPEEEESLRHIEGLDRIIGQILDDNPEIELYLTADHGMSAKTQGVDLEKLLKAQGIEARAIPIIKDRYIEHHQNLGGASYVYLEDSELIFEAIEILRDFSGIEAVYHRDEAAERFDLMSERIGDIFVLGNKDTVFGHFRSVKVPVKLRSHGSRHESAVPIISYGSNKRPDYKKNFDIVTRLEID